MIRRIAFSAQRQSSGVSSAFWPTLFFAAYAIVLLLTPGCGTGATRANPIGQSVDRVESATYGTSKFVRVDAQGGSLNIDTNLPTYASRLGLRAEYVRGPAGDIVDVYLVPEVDSAGGGASHEMTVPLGKNQYAALRSATVFKIRAETYTAKPDGEVAITGLEIGSDAASANVSVAEVVQALAPTWAAWSADDRARFETLAKSLADVGTAWGRAAIDAVAILKRGAMPVP
ncbi:MAG: hypothetical protein ACK4WH_01025 [Phycisphaerales bacterium]